MEDNLIQEINDLLNQNGKIRQAVRDRLILLCISEIYRATQTLPDIRRRVERLENRSLLLLAEKHPKAALSLLTLFFLLMNLWMIGDVRRLILPLLGLPADWMP